MGTAVPIRKLFNQLREGVTRVVWPPPVSSQGLHLDPNEIPAPDPEYWSADQRAAWSSREMTVYRECLELDGMDARAGILDDLSKYHHLSPEEARHRCLHWEDWSVKEWMSGDRSTKEGLQAFYDSVESWSFDLLWYTYLQTCGFGYPAPVLAARFANEHCPAGSHLDFGSGVGATSQLFKRLGHKTMLADVSKPLLDFATWRLERRGDHAPTLNLVHSDLPASSFDVITAIDTLVHVPDFDATVHQLHRALRPGGWLLTNFDVRPPGVDTSAWHLYHDALELEHRLRRAGFVDRGRFAGITIRYQRVEPRGAMFQVRGLRDDLLLKSPGSVVTSTGRRIGRPTPQRLGHLARRVVELMKG